MVLGAGTVEETGRWSTRGLENSGRVVHCLTWAAKSGSMGCWAFVGRAMRAAAKTSREDFSMDVGLRAWWGRLN